MHNLNSQYKNVFFHYTGKQILNELKENICLICIDEAHANLKSQWGSKDFREEMYLAPSFLKAQISSVSPVPVLAMTATARIKGEKRKFISQVDEINTMCWIQFSYTRVISISPVLHNHLYVVMKKPASSQGFYGKNAFSLAEGVMGYRHSLSIVNFKPEFRDGQF